MAGAQKRRVNDRADTREQYIYEYDGSAVREVEVAPKRTYEKKKKVNRAALKNRERARRMSGGFVMFLAAASAAAMFMCVHYLKLKSEITTQAKQIAVMETNINQLKADNDAYYNSVLSSMDLEHIKEVAMERLDMDYPNEHQIFRFDTAGNSYLRQYRSIPDAE